MQQRAEDPAVGLSASLSVKEAELFITLMAGVTLPWSFSFSGLFFFPLFLFVFFLGGVGFGLVFFGVCIWKASSRCCPVLCTVCPLAQLKTEEETTSLPLGRGGLSPAPHGRAASPEAEGQKRGGKRPCLSCDISAGLMTNPGSAPHPLEIR